MLFTLGTVGALMFSLSSSESTRSITSSSESGSGAGFAIRGRDGRRLEGGDGEYCGGGVITITSSLALTGVTTSSISASIELDALAKEDESSDSFFSASDSDWFSSERFSNGRTSLLPT